MQRVSYITDPERRLYAAMICALDDGVGQVVQTLTANNILNNTLIFFLSDNGAPYDRKFDGTLNSNLPLRGYKEDMLEGGIHIPFAVQWPARLAPNTNYNGVVSSLDIILTVAAAAGITLPTDRVFDGIDIMPYLTGLQKPQDRNLFWRWFGLGDTGPFGAVNSIWAIRSGSFKLVVERAKDTLPPALYDLKTDLGETTDLASTRPDKVAKLQALQSMGAERATRPVAEDSITSFCRLLWLETGTAMTSTILIFPGPSRRLQRRMRSGPRTRITGLRASFMFRRTAATLRRELICLTLSRKGDLKLNGVERQST